VTGPRSPLLPGQPAPQFTLPVAHQEGVVSLYEYRGKTPVLLAFDRGLYCCFCRRHLVQLGIMRKKLKAAGVEVLAIVATRAERARLYFQFRPTSLPVACDPEAAAHRAYGIPRPALTPQLVQDLQTVRINPTGELPEPVPIAETSVALDPLDRFEPTAVDLEEDQRHHGRDYFLLTGQFLVDRNGIIRWVNIEGAAEGMAGWGKFPSEEELLTAARALVEF
jgi:peroxiredoxin